MPPTITSVSTLSSRFSITSIFARDLRSANDRHKGLLRRFQSLAEIGDFLFHQQAGHGGLQEVRDPLGRRVRAVRRAERVVDIDLGQRGERLRESRIVGFFFRVEAEILEQQYLAGLQLARHFTRNLPTQFGEKATFSAGAHVLIDQFAQPVDHRSKRILGVRLAFGTAQVRGQDDLGVAP